MITPEEIDELSFLPKPCTDKDLAILHAARSEFAQQGYYNANMDRIALESGIGKGTLYRHFVNKHTLFFATIEVGFRDFFAKVKLIDAEAPLEEQLDAYLDLNIEFLMNNSDLLRLVMHEQSKIMETMSEGDLRNRMVRLQQVFGLFWERTLTRAAEARELRPGLNLVELGRLLDQLFRTVFADFFMLCDKSGLKRDDLLRRKELFQSLLLHGLLAKS